MRKRLSFIYLTGALGLASFPATFAIAETVTPAVQSIAIQKHENVSSFVLDNGMKVVVIEDHRAPVVTHMVWYNVGAADEPWGQSGIAHFFEHLMFKGTKEIAAGQFSKIIARNGGQDNAFTSQDYTAYYQRIARDKLEMVMRMEADRMKNLQLDVKNVATERNVVLEERSQRVDNNPSARFSEQVDATFYTNHPYGVPVIGWRGEIENLSYAQAITFYGQHYAPDQAILVVAGDTTPQDVEQLAQKYYAPLEPSGAKLEKRPIEPAHTMRKKVTMTDPRVGQPYVIQSYLVPSHVTDPQQAAALDVLVQLMDGGATGSLYASLQDQGLAIDSGAFYRGMARDKTKLSVYAVPTSGTDLKILEQKLEETVLALHSGEINTEKLSQAKQVFLNNLIYQQDSQVSLANMYGAALAIGLTVEDIQSYAKRIENVTAQDIQDVAQAYLLPEISTTGWLLKQHVPSQKEMPTP